MICYKATAPCSTGSPSTFSTLINDRNSETGLRAQHAHCRTHRSGRPARRRAGDGAPRLRFRGPYVFQRLFHHRCARSGEPARGELHRGTCGTRGTFTCRLMKTCCWSFTPRTCSPPPNSPTSVPLLQRRSRAEKARRDGREAKRQRQLERRPSGLRHLEAENAQISSSCRSKASGLPPCLVHRRALGLRVGPARRLYRLHVHDSQHERYRQAGKPVDGRFPGMNLAAGETPSWPAARRLGLHHAVIHGNQLRRLARRRMVVLDIADRSKPKLIVHRNWPPRSAAAHIIACPCPTATCWSCSMKPCSTTRKNLS